MYISLFSFILVYNQSLVGEDLFFVQVHMSELEFEFQISFANFQGTLTIVSKYVVFVV